MNLAEIWKSVRLVRMPGNVSGLEQIYYWLRSGNVSGSELIYKA
jgi:hypothetical protein